MTRSVEEQVADIERRMKQLRARKQRIVARENAKARKRRTLGPHGVAPRESALTLNVTTGNM